MSKKLHEEALAAAIEAAEDWVWDETGPWPPGTQGDEVLVLAYVAHLAAHGWKLTPREPTDAMVVASNAVLWGEAYETEEEVALWQAAYDAAPSWPGDAE